MTLASRPRAARALLQLCVSVQPEYRQSASEGKEGAALRRRVHSDRRRLRTASTCAVAAVQLSKPRGASGA